MKQKRVLLVTVFIALLVSVCSWQACKKIRFGCGGPMVGNEPTTVMLIFRNVNNPADADTAICTNGNWRDVSKAHLTLSANTGYHVQVMFLNITAAKGSSGYDVTPSVLKEGTSYLVCFNDSINLYGNLGANLSWVRQDMDNGAKPLPIGLTDSFWTGADSSCGIMTTTLHHQYQVKNGDCEPGYIDIEALDTIYISPNKG